MLTLMFLFAQQPSAIAFNPKNELLVCDAQDGSVWNATQKKRIAAGLDKPSGLACVGERLFVIQRQELTELIDRDQDGAADTYSCLCAAWKVGKDPAESARGLSFAEGWFTTTLSSGERIRIALADGHHEAAPAAAAEARPLIPEGFGPYTGQAYQGGLRWTSEESGSCQLSLAGLVARAGSGQPGLDLLCVRARSNGFELEFTETIAPGFGWDPALWSVEAEKPLVVRSASVTSDRKHVELEVEGLAAGQSLTVRSLGPVPTQKGVQSASSEARYMLAALPKDKPVAVIARPRVEPNTLTDTAKGQGWKLLFDGKGIEQWRGYKQPDMPQGWVVEDGALVCSGGGGDLVSREEYSDFELALEWKIAPGGNSGIFFHGSEDHGYIWETAPEMQILDDARHADGKNPKTSAGSNYALIAPPPGVVRPVGCWNEVRLLVAGSHVEHWMNGVKLFEYELWSPEWIALVAASKFATMPEYGLRRTGRIALQDHGDKVWFRSIRIRPMGLR